MQCTPSHIRAGIGRHYCRLSSDGSGSDTRQIQPSSNDSNTVTLESFLSINIITRSKGSVNLPQGSVKLVVLCKDCKDCTKDYPEKN